MGTTASSRTARQVALSNLERANETRAIRSRVRRHWKSLSPPEALREFAALVRLQPSWAASWPVGQAMDHLPQVGPHKVRLVLKAAMVPALVEIGAMTDRQREALIAELLAYAARSESWRG